MSETFITTLQQVVDLEWINIKQGQFWSRVLEQPVSRSLYKKLMIEVYHYTKHNSINQAAAAFLGGPDSLLRFVYGHAADELGHEKMALHDLRSVDLLNSQDLQRSPLPATEALIGYLYFVALKYGPVARLGYSFWAENSYVHIDQIISKIRADLTLEDKNLSFFVAHGKIDLKHQEQVMRCLLEHAITDEHQNLVCTVARTSLYLTGQMLEQIAVSEKAAEAQG